MTDKQQTPPNNPATEPIRFKAVIFDMDGTLIESTMADYLAWKRLFTEYGQELTYEAYYPMLGTKSADLVRLKLNLQGVAIDEALARKMHYFTEVVDTEGVELVPFAEALVRSIRQYPVGIALATSSRRPKTEMLLERTGLRPCFDVLVTGEEISNGKPAPDIFLLAAERLGVAPADCVVFEDTVSGIRGAKGAGMKCVAIATTHKAEELQQADLVLDSFETVCFPDLCLTLVGK